MFQKTRNIVAFFVLLFSLTVLTPWFFGSGHWFGLATFPGILFLSIAVRRLERQFGIPPITIRTEPNHWAGVTGGLFGGFGGLVGANLLNVIELAQLPSVILLFIIYSSLLATLFYGAILQDIKNGYIEVEPDR